MKWSICKIILEQGRDLRDSESVRGEMCYCYVRDIAVTHILYPILREKVTKVISKTNSFLVTMRGTID